MFQAYDFLIPLHRVRWNTRAVLEGITTCYQPRTIHIIAPSPQIEQLRELSPRWSIDCLELHQEEEFFNSTSLTKEKICAELDLGKSLYTPGWFYQQLLKLGAFISIGSLSEWYLVWDSDLLPVNSWSIIDRQTSESGYSFALLQHKDWGNSQIVRRWKSWINTVLEVDAIEDSEGTFIPHHMWFKQEHLKSFASKVNERYQSNEHWLILMMRSANEFDTFSEYWSYASWVQARSPQDLSFHPYHHFGLTTERFFDDGTGLFSTALKRHRVSSLSDELYPSYADIYAFIQSHYKDALPSSLSFEGSPRHLKKDRQNLHIEELRSRWNPRQTENQREVVNNKY